MGLPHASSNTTIVKTRPLQAIRGATTRTSQDVPRNARNLGVNRTRLHSVQTSHQRGSSDFKQESGTHSTGLASVGATSAATRATRRETDWEKRMAMSRMNTKSFECLFHIPSLELFIHFPQFLYSTRCRRAHMSSTPQLPVVLVYHQYLSPRN